jgi:hypothetical protein
MITLFIFCIFVTTIFYVKLDQDIVTSRGREYERRGLVIIHSVYIGLSLDQQLHGFVVVQPCGNV